MANNTGEIDLIAGSEALKQIDALIAKVTEADIAMVKLATDALAVNRNVASITTPKGLNEQIANNQKITAEFTNQQNAIERTRLAELKLQQAREQSIDKYNAKLKAQADSEAKVAQAIAKKNGKTSEEIVNGRALALNADRQTKATSLLVGAYTNLSAKHAQAKKTLQDLIASQTASTAQIKRAQAEFNILDQRVTKADQAVRVFNRNVGNYPTGAISGIKSLIGAFGIVGGVSLFATMAKDIFQTTKELQSLDKALLLVAGSQQNFATQQQFLKRISEDYGLEIQGLTKQFTQFYVSAKDKLSATQIQGIFESISKAGSAMGLSVQSQERAFLAINQMMSKGTVQAEELRGQLGEALPGALGIMAKSLGVTEKQLGEMMKKGEILASDVLPKFAKQLEITYGIENVNRIDTLAAAQTRLSNAWTSFVASLDKDGNKLSNFFKGFINVSSDIVAGIERIFESSEQGRKRTLEFIKKSGYNDEKKLLQNMNEQQKQNAVSEREYVRDRISDINAEIQALNNRNSVLTKSRKGANYGKSISIEREIIANNKAIYLQNNLLANNVGLRMALDEALDDSELVQSKDTETKKKATKAIKEKTILTFDEVKSQYDLKIAILERQKAEANDRIGSGNLEQQIKARQDFSAKSIEILDLQLQKENALIQEKGVDDITKNNLAYKNKELTYAQWAKNVKDINSRLNNELSTSDSTYSLKWNDLLNSDAAFYKKIEEEKRGYTEKTRQLIIKSAQDAFKKQSENENATLKSRQKAFEEYVKMARAELDLAKIKEQSNATSIEQLDNITQKYAELNSQIDALASPTEKAKEKFKEYLATVASGELENSLNAIGLSGAKMFLDFDAHGQTTFSKMWALAETTKEKFAVAFKGIGDIVKGVLSEMSEASASNAEADIQRLENQKAIDILYAGDSAAAKADIEKEYQKQIKKAKDKEAKAQKRFAEFQIGINTAQGISAALATANIPLAIAIGVLGAIQLAVVESKEIPAYKLGTQNHKGGAMLVNDGGGSDYQETVVTPDGNIFQPTGKNVIMNKPSGTKVFTNKQWRDQLDSMVFNNGISWNNEGGNAIDNTLLVDIKNAIVNKTEYRSSFDKSGFKEFITNGNVETEIQNKRSQGIGKSV